MNSVIERLAESGEGVYRLAPAWVPRSFCRPGQRIKIHPSDLYVYGLERGGIDERWLASTTHAENGPLAAEDEGHSYVVSQDGKDRVLLRDVVDHLKGEIIGDELWKRFGCWPVYSKFFDNVGPLPHHIHHNDEKAALTGQKGKPEMYFFPAQMNNYGGEFAFTAFGLNSDVTVDQVKEALKNFHKGDNQILEMSRIFKLEVDTGWDVPPGVLHAPGSLCTYEPQFASDVFAMYQSVLLGGHCVPVELLWKDTPKELVGDYDHLISIIDWEKNVDPDFHKNRFMRPIPVTDMEEMQKQGYVEEWICYKSELVCAKRLTIHPGASVTISDSAAYGFIVIQGHGTCNKWNIESPTLIRFGQLTNDEFFVSEPAAKRGVTFTNPSSEDPIVLLKHFAINPDLKL